MESFWSLDGWWIKHVFYHEGSMIRVHCQLMICRGHIRASKDALQIFLWLIVLCEN